MQPILSGVVGIGAAIAVVCLIKGIFILLEITNGEIARWFAYVCALFVAYLIGDAIRELRRERR